jgi:hypothetical protein
MAEEKLVELIRWLRAEQRPHYALLPRDEYLKSGRRGGCPLLKRPVRCSPKFPARNF